MAKHSVLWLLKLIGIAVFLWILSQIDRTQVFKALTNANVPLLLGAFFLQYGIYGAKTLRWNRIVELAGGAPTLRDSWRIYNIGIFLATVTPAKLGEFGRATYLRAAGMNTATAVSLVMIDKLFDMALIALIAIAGTGILFGGNTLLWLLIGGALIGSVCAVFTWKKLRRIIAHASWEHLYSYLSKPTELLKLVLATVINWCIYFTWAVLVARSIGIETSVPILVSTFTITGILSLLPIAPSGMGTRDAALVVLLAPYGVAAEQAVALAILMFVSIVFSGALGLWYWLGGVRHCH